MHFNKLSLAISTAPGRDMKTKILGGYDFRNIGDGLPIRGQLMDIERGTVIMSFLPFPSATQTNRCPNKMQ